MPEGQQISLTRNPDVLPDDLLDEYEPQGTDPLGEGAFAVVRLLRRRKTGELFALKCVEKYPLQIRNMLPQMQREVRIHKALSHPNILQLVRVFDDPAYVFMLLEYCEKGPLRQWVAEAPNSRLREPEAAFYFEQIVNGVEWMHRNNCVHRDLKLENMLLTAKDEIKICDFGWSAEVETDRLLKTTCGTTAYWAPELWESEPQDEAVDLWALGCLLYEMLASHPPFFAREKQDLSTMVLKLHFACPPWFSSEACHCVQCLLKLDPHQRLRSKDLLRHPWLRKQAGAAAPLTGRSCGCLVAPNEAPTQGLPPPPAPPPPPQRPLGPPPLVGPLAGHQTREPGRLALLPPPPTQAATTQPLPSPGKPLLLPAPKLAAEATTPSGTGSSGAKSVPEQRHTGPRPVLRHGQPLPLDRRCGTVERRIAWDLPTARAPVVPGSAILGGPAIGPQGLGWEEALAAAREAAAREAGFTAAVRAPQSDKSVPSPVGRTGSNGPHQAPQSDKSVPSPVGRTGSNGPHQAPQSDKSVPSPVGRTGSNGPHQAPSPTRNRAPPPPTANLRPSDPLSAACPGARFSLSSSGSIGKESSTPSQHHSTSPAHRWATGGGGAAGSTVRTPAETSRAAAPTSQPNLQQPPGTSRFGCSVKTAPPSRVVTTSVSPTRSAGGAGYGPAVMPSNPPTSSLRLPLPSAQSFPAHHIFASPEAGCTTPLSSALVPSGKAQSFSVQSPTTSFFLQSMALPASPVSRSPAPHHPPPQSPQHSGPQLAHSSSGSIAVATPNGGFAAPPPSGSVVVRHTPPGMQQSNFYASGMKPKVFFPFGTANDSFSLDTSATAQAVAA